MTTTRGAWSTSRPAEGVDAELRLFEDTVHVFPLLSFLPEAEEALGDLAAFVARTSAAPRAHR